MRLKYYVVILMFVAVSFLQGCETAKGLKKDLIKLKNIDIHLDKADEWMQEHMW